MSVIMFSDCEPNIRIDLSSIITYYPYISEKVYIQVNEDIDKEALEKIGDTDKEKTLVIYLSTRKEIKIEFDTREMLFNSLAYLDDVYQMIPIHTSNKTLPKPKPNKGDRYRMSSGVIGA